MQHGSCTASAGEPSEFQFYPQRTRQAPACACVALSAKIKGKGQASRRGEGKAEFAYARAAPEIRLADVVAVRRGFDSAIESIFPGRSDVWADTFVHRIREAGAHTQAVTVHGPERYPVACRQGDCIAVLSSPEVFGVCVQRGLLVDIPEISSAEMQAVIRRTGVIVRAAASEEVSEIGTSVFIVDMARPEAGFQI